MAYESDEEQIEALKSWWDENGTFLIVGIVVVLAVLFASRQWQGSRTDEIEAASATYQEMAELVLTDTGSALSDSDFDAVNNLNTQLRGDFENSIYARYGALLMAKVFVEQDKLESAAEELNWVLDNPDLGMFVEAEDELFLIARLRLGRVYLAQDKASDTISLLTAIDAGVFAGSYAEIEGDAHLALGQIGDARAAYQRALLSSSNPDLLTLKIEDLGE